jgi:hypothetical protein
MRWLLVAGLAACSHNSMAIEVVTSDRDVARVELVIVQGKCDTCTGDAPPSSLAKPTGDVYYQLAGDRFTAPVTSGVAGFTLEPGADDNLAKLGAIGFDAQGVPKAIALIDQDIHIKQHLGEVIQVQLQTRDIVSAAGALPGTFTIGANDEVVVWRAPSAPDTAPSCIAVLGAGSAATATNTFVVPPDDSDCDGITGAAECDPFWYMYSKPTDSAHPQYCLEQAAAAKPCQIGTEIGCVDGQSQAGCMPAGYCVPNQACTDCTDPTDPQCPDHVGNDSVAGVPRIHCTIPLVGAPGNYTSCPTGIAAINIDTPYTGGATCAPPLLIKTPLTFPVTAQQSIGIDTGQGPVSLLIAGFMSPCEFQIIPMATVSSIPSHSVPALVQLHGPTRQILLPLVVDFTNANTTVCSGALTAASCTVSDSFVDPMWTCATH